MSDHPTENEPTPNGPRKPPQMSALFVIVWVLGLLALIALAGCTVVLAAYAVSELDAAAFIGILVMMAALFVYGRGLIRGRRLERAQQPPSTLFLYIFLIPVVAVFVWAGGCLLALP